MSENIFKESVARVNKIFDDIFIKTIVEYTIPVRLRMIDNMTQSGTDENINWAKIQELLTVDTNEFSYNNFKMPTSKEELQTAHVNAIASECGLGAYLKCHCKKCNEDFYMGYGEVLFFMEKGFGVPKHCKSCKAGQKKEQAIKPIVGIVGNAKPTKTAMQLAFEKAESGE